MSIRKLSLTVIVFLLSFSFAAFSREAVPVVDYIDMPVTNKSGQSVNADQVRDAIIRAATVNQWQINKNSSHENLISAALVVRGKHTVVVSIPYSAEKFSIKYQNSINMKYDVAKGAPGTFPGAPDSNSSSKDIHEGTRVIHPFYNKWVNALLLDIQSELAKL